MTDTEQTARTIIDTASAMAIAHTCENAAVEVVTIIPARPGFSYPEELQTETADDVRRSLRMWVLAPILSIPVWALILWGIFG